MSITRVNVVVPSAGDGPLVDISALVGKKTVELSGVFTGRYVLLGSLNDINFVPILEFESNGKESIELSLAMALKSVRVRSEVTSSSNVTMNVTALSSGGTNNFTTLGTLNPGASGAQAILDTYTVFPVTGLETNINYQCIGNFVGLITIEGSMDGVNFNPIGGFRASPQPPSLLSVSTTLEFSPIVSDELVRYIRLVVDGTIQSTVVVTMGGAIFTSIAPPTPGGGGVSVAEDRESTAGNTEVIIFEALVDLDRLGATMTPYLTAIGFVSAAGGVSYLRMYLGATTPGDTSGGTEVVMIATASLTPIGFNGIGAVLANAGGPSLLQITLQQPVPGLLTTTVRGYIGGLF